ncbi:MAG: polysaccharide deacetylase 2 family uncharacterized protein YibQ [Candidatus Omnitrophota bacterium]|jgi:polysaccharide deacetylase 2 family uncharacterized protein YibQ
MKVKIFLGLLLVLGLGALVGYNLAKLSIQEIPDNAVLESAASTEVTEVAETTLDRYSDPVQPGKTKAYVSIVLDDWGYNLKAYDKLINLQTPITVAILPHLAYSKKIAIGAYNQGHEIILHMPMEPIGNVSLEKNTLLTSMTGADITQIFYQALSAVPYIRGFSNHMGSKFTDDTQGLKTVFALGQGRGLFFLNSLVTSNAVALSLAEESGIPYLERDVFIDNERNEEAIELQLDQLKKRALVQGMAIGIGHDEVITLEAIEAILPQWKNEGIEVISLSQMLEYKRMQKIPLKV